MAQVQTAIKSISFSLNNITVSDIDTVLTQVLEAQRLQGWDLQSAVYIPAPGAHLRLNLIKQ